MHPWRPDDVVFESENDNFIKYTPKEDDFFLVSIFN